MVHGFLGENPQLTGTEAGGLGVQPREGCSNALAGEVQLPHQPWSAHSIKAAVQAVLCSYAALSKRLGLLPGNVKSTSTGSTAAATL